jgi:hypothetical protein
MRAPTGPARAAPRPSAAFSGGGVGAGTGADEGQFRGAVLVVLKGEVAE